MEGQKISNIETSKFEFIRLVLKKIGKPTKFCIKSQKGQENVMGQKIMSTILGLISDLQVNCAKRTVPKEIGRPDYADHPEGVPLSEQNMRLTAQIKNLNDEEIEGMRVACKLGREVLEEASKAIEVGVTADEIYRIVHNTCVERECYPSPLNYYKFPRSCCTSVNEVICHGIPDLRPLENGDICNVDITVYHRGYHGDLNEPFWVGDVSVVGKKLTRVTWECLQKAIDIVKPGEKYREIGNIIQKHAQANGFSVVRSYCGHGIHELFYTAPRYLTMQIPRTTRLFLLRLFNTSRRKMSSDADESVLFTKKKSSGIITLNKPKSLNAIDTCMVHKITEQIKEWEKSLELIVIQGVGRAFCAGGDVVSLTKDFPNSIPTGKDFFSREYTMNYLVANCKIPYIAVLDGITMGGGVGLSIHGRYRIATENTLFAMPETAIGLIPDVGASYFLSRLPGGLGPYLGLTGKRLNGLECLKAGIATHYMESKDLPNFFHAVNENRIKRDTIDKDLAEFTKDSKSCLQLFPQSIELIDKIFIKDSIHDIYDALEKDGSGWATETKQTLDKMSPTALKITVKQMKEAKHKTLQECLKMEYRLAVSALNGKVSKDFYEGVRAMLVDKDRKPKWDPPHISKVKDDRVATAFEEIGPDELKL